MFSQLRDAEELSEDYRSSDDEIDINLDQDLLKEFTQYSPCKPRKMLVSKTQDASSAHHTDHL